MAQQVTLGGDRIGSGNKQKVELHNYGMTSFNLEQDWKSSMAPGILYPFLKLVGTNHGTFDIDLDSFIRTLPTKGPLFGQFKFQADIYCVPIRLYQGILHNNPVGIGLKMNQVYLPKIRMGCTDSVDTPRVEGSDEYNWQINESSLAKYLGLSGIGRYTRNILPFQVDRKFNAIPFLAYYDIFKCYYSNKQEENAYVITPKETPEQVNSITRVLQGNVTQEWDQIINDYNPYNNEILTVNKNDFKTKLFQITAKKVKTITTKEDYLENIRLFNEAADTGIYLDSVLAGLTINGITEDQNNVYIAFQVTDWQKFIDNIEAEQESDSTTVNIQIIGDYETNYYTSTINLTPFKLQNIDDMRNALLSANELGSEFVIGAQEDDSWGLTSGGDGTGLPYSTLFKTTTQGILYNAFTDNGLVVKTYQSDLFNNWLNTEYIDGESGIAALTAVTVSEGSFTIDSLNLAEKIYEVLNRIAVSGGTYEDWQEAVYGEGAVRKAETPMYMGGMSAEVMFEEVISTAETNVASGEGLQALGSLGGKGTQVGKHGGNNIHIKCEEPCYIMGICSLTPRVCYSQGNDWDMTDLETLDDLHKPALDGIGFQDLIIEQMAWWNANVGTAGLISRQSAGKQTAWINYQTAVDKCYGDFAKANGNAFMVLNRNYEIGDTKTSVKDITTYIDPAKFNYAFAYADLAAQNFWVQIHSKVIARRKMGAQQIPNL